MAIPAFDSGGDFLPIGSFAGPLPDAPEESTYSAWATTPDEIHERFVLMYPNSTTRSSLWQQLDNLKHHASALLRCSVFFVSGGLVMDVDDPLDAHLVLVTPANHVNGLPPRSLWLIQWLFDDRERAFGGATELTITTQFVRVYPTDHHRYPETLVSLASARLECGSPAHDDRDGGYVQFQDCEGGESDDQALGLLAEATSPTGTP